MPRPRMLELAVPAFAFIVATRAALAGGVGLLVSERLPGDRRRAIGTALVAIGAASTIPAAYMLIQSLRRSRRRPRPAGVEFEPALIGATRFPRKGDDDGD